jgi:pyruvate/2-oxoglutarate dehydrogenase complex dihydrolipoamide dehydrogenase (E3) component
MEQADAIVIGSGQSGVPFATKLAGKGRQVVLFERGHFGGSCLNYGCYPSKAFLYAAHLAGLEAETGYLGLHAKIEVNFPEVMDRVRDIVAESSQGVEKSLKDSKVKVVPAEASFVGERTVKGGDMTVQAPLIVINTGNSPFVPPINGLKGTPYFTYLNFWELDILPPTTIIIGGGYIGLELGQGLAQLGSQVHVIEMQERIAHMEEPDVSEVLAESLEEDGVNLYTNTSVEQVDFENEIFTVTLSDGELLNGQALLVAAGQVPNTKALNVPEAGIELDERGFVKVDDQFKTTAEGIYAIGDVTGQPAFTHVSWEDYRRLF